MFNPVELFPETESDRQRLEPERARLRGLELLLRGPEERRWSWWTAYAYSLAEDRIAGNWEPRNWDQPHAFRFLVGFRPDERWSVSLSGLARSGWPTTSATAQVVSPGGVPQAEVLLGPRNSDRLEAYRRIDLKAHRRFNLSRGKLKLELEVLNVTDRRNVCCIDEVEAELIDPTTARLIRDPDFWLGIVPSASLTWEF